VYYATLSRLVTETPMKSFRRIVLLATLAFVVGQPGALLVPSALSAAPVSTIKKTKKRKKHKTQKEVVLKGRRGKRARKPSGRNFSAPER
jgi:hypothetical protein